jgi:hypothetical protein
MANSHWMARMAASQTLYYTGGFEQKMVLVLNIHQEWWTSYKTYINHLSQHNGVREYLPMVGFLALGDAVCGPFRTLIVSLGYLVQFLIFSLEVGIKLE